MTTRRDWLLDQLGITQWTLRRPSALSGEVAVVLPPGIRLLVVSAVPPPADHPFVGDVARSLGLSWQQLYLLTPEQVMMLPEEIECHSWWLGLEAPPALSGSSFSTPPLTELQGNAAAKRHLWQQICRYEQDFFPEHR